MIASLVVALAASSAFAQNYPMPGSASAAPVICTNCEGSNASGELNKGLPTYPYRAPITRFVGRYVDSSTTLSIQHVGFRTARSGRNRFAGSQRGSVPPRAYLTVGECVAGYTMPSLFDTVLPSAMESVGIVNTGSRIAGTGRDPLEKIQIFDSFIYPEATMSGWKWQLFDTQHTLGDFDFDDRGMVYAAFPPYGWAIMRDGATGGSHMAFQWQDWEDKTIPQPYKIISLKANNRYYVITSETSATKHMRWDVTDPTNPTVSVTRTGPSWGIGAWAKYDAGQRLAYIGGDGLVHIWNYSDFVTSGQEIISFPMSADRSALDIAFDENGTLWVAETDPRRVNTNVLTKITPSGSTYVRQTFDVYGKKFSPKYISAAGGFVALAGSSTIYTGSNGLDVILLKVNGGVPTKVDTDDFFTKYYHTAPSGYAQPPVNGGYTGLQSGIALYKWEGKVYLFYSAFGLGDVYELEGSDSISIQMKTASFGTVNPNSKATQTGPFLGDIVTFNAKSSNPSQTYSVNWDFGNPDSESLNYKTSNTGVDVTHQYTGLTSATQISQAKSVTVNVSGDTSISAALPVALKVPEVRAGFPNGANAWTAVTSANAAANLKAVAGQVFTDASDGSVESHFGTWNIDGVDTTIKPNGTVPVGALGQHTAKLTASYGRYDNTLFTITKPYNTATGNIVYTVVPFMAKMNTPVKSGTNVTFSGTGIYTTDTSILSATQWTVTWTLSSAGASAAATQSNTVALGQIPNFVVPAPIAPNSTITLDVSVDPTKVNGPSQYASTQESQILSTPDPKIVVTGCDHVGDPCQVTATSISGASTSDWAVTWTIKQSGNQIATGTTNPFSPALSEAGSYSISLKVVKTVFEANAADKLLTVGAALCGPLPTAEEISISSGCSTNCQANTDIKFIASSLAYNFQDCDSFTWNFGDGGTGTGKSLFHKFTTNKTYTVKLTVKNATNTTGISTTESITVGSSSNPDPQQPTCAAPDDVMISGWSGQLGCSPTQACKVGELITFFAKRASASTLLSCDTVDWQFGDGNSTTNKVQTRNTYNNAGTYEISLVVTNEFGSSQAIKRNITIVPDTNSSCANAPTEGSIVVKYEGATSGCRDTNTTPCQKGEAINFRISTIGYSMQTCDNVSWNFGDNTTSTSRTPSKTYPTSATAGSYHVVVTVSNTNGQATGDFTVPFTAASAEPAPQLTFESFPTTGQTNKSITFKVNSNLSATGWVWNFGDTGSINTNASQIGTSNTMTHTFTTKGNYKVSVSARNAAGQPTDQVGSVLSPTIVIAEAPAIPTYKYLLPVVTHIGGQNNSSWRTDVQVYSQDPTVSPSKPLTMSAVLRDMTRTLEIPSSTYIYEDFMRVFTTGNDSGPVVITVQSQYAPQIWTRTYNVTEAGTFGQFIPAIRIDEAGAGSAFGSGKYFIAGLRHNDRYRTNLGFVNPNPSSVNALIKVFNDHGESLGSFTRPLGSFQLDQFAITAALPSLPKDRPFSVEISVPEGQWLIAYASLIDGGSNDPVFVQAVRESDLKSEDYRTLMVPGVGHTGAWRSDATVFNANGRQVNVDLTYYDGTGAKKGEALNVPIKGGEFLQYDDLIKQGVFGSVDDSVGMMRIAVTPAFSEELFPLAFARTYNDDGSGRTFGQGISGFAAARANVKANKPALIPAVRDNSRFYTNIGLTNTTGSPVTATVKLLDPATGLEVLSRTYELSAYQSVVGEFKLEGRDNASLKVEANGSIWAFASIIDRNTKDPEYVAATPLP